MTLSACAHSAPTPSALVAPSNPAGIAVVFVLRLIRDCARRLSSDGPTPRVLLVLLKRRRTLLDAATAQADLWKLRASPAFIGAFFETHRAGNARHAMVLSLMHDRLVGQRQALATEMASVMTFDERSRRIIGIPRSVAKIAQHIFVLHIHFIGTWSKHARSLGCARLSA